MFTMPRGGACNFARMHVAIRGREGERGAGGGVDDGMQTERNRPRAPRDAGNRVLKYKGIES